MADHTDEERGEAILQHVIGVVEPLTRFDRACFERVSASTEIVPVMAWQSFRVAFHVDQDSGAGGMPGGTDALADASAVRAHLDGAMAAARRARPGRLQRWIEAQAAQPTTTPLLPRDCLANIHLVGYEEGCDPCA